MNDRIARLRQRLVELKLDAIVVSRNEDQRYLCGVSGHADYDSVIFVSQDDVCIATDFRYWEYVRLNAPGLGLIQLERGKYDLEDALADLARKNGVTRIGIEPHHVNVYRYRRWSRKARRAGAKLVLAEDVIKWLRAVKDETEQSMIRRAVELTDCAFAHLRAHIRPGMTEKECARRVEAFMLDNGADRLAFPPIIASGPNAALAHGEPSNRAIQMNEPIIVDIGAMVGGYCADMTRTICLGEANEMFFKIYNVVLQAQQIVESKARVGMTGKQIDRLARRVVEKSGYGGYFGHGLGHGVGLVVHEFPRANKFSKDRIAPGMTLTVEPGIYIPGWGGVRIEDLVVFGDDGVQVLTSASKDPLVIQT